MFEINAILGENSDLVSEIENNLYEIDNLIKGPGNAKLKMSIREALYFCRMMNDKAGFIEHYAKDVRISVIDV